MHSFLLDVQARGGASLEGREVLAAVLLGSAADCSRRMTIQQLFYNNVVPLSPERHAGWHIRTLKDYSFTSRTNSVPLMTAEFLQASRSFPIVFAGSEEQLIPVQLLGVRREENVFLGPEGAWEGGYMPAFIRRYPFIFSNSAESENFFLCIDESYPGFNQQGEGPALIDEDGKPSPFTDQILKFLGTFQSETLRTQAFCRKIKELNLLEPKVVEINGPDGNKATLTGFQAVDRDRLPTLSSEAIVDLVRSGAYELICHHLASLNNFDVLLGRTPEHPAPEPEHAEHAS